MAIELDQDIMITNVCVKFGEDWTNSFQELDRKQFSYRQGQPYMPPPCGGHKNILPTCMYTFMSKQLTRFEKCFITAFAFM